MLHLTREMLAGITDVELAFGTEKLLPPWEEIDQSFKDGNIYTRLAEAIHFGSPLPDAEIVFKEGFEADGVAQELNRCVRAHLTSFGPKHQHKVAGVGWIIAQVCEMHEVLAGA